MARKLKQYRVKARLTQTELAKAVGVSQPNYQRWESGAAPVPEDKLKKLAKVLKTTIDALQGTHSAIRAGFYDDSVGEDLNYYGEVAIHFCGGGQPILLSISDGAFARLHRALQTCQAFVRVESLANQTVIIRRQAIADVCFTSEAYDYFGFSSEHYAERVELQMPDARDWEIVEAMACDGVGLEDFTAEDIQRVTEWIMITDEQYAGLVSDGSIKPENLEAEKAKNQQKTDQIFDLATNMTYQLSNGQRRSMYIMEPMALFAAFELLLESIDDDPGDDFIRLPVVDWHCIAFLNHNAMDYVILPTHQLEQGRVEMEARLLDELE